MTLLRRAWLWLTLALGSVVLALYSLWRRATRQRDEARNQRDAAIHSATRERDLGAKTAAIEAEHKTAGEIVAAKRAQIVVVREAKRAETDAALDVEDLARVETARRRAREARK